MPKRVSIRSYFDLDEKIVFLNSGAQSICPRPVLAAVIRNLKSYETNPTSGLFNAWPQLWEVQKSVANFLEAEPDDIFFRPSATEALNEIVLGLPMPPDSELLTTDGEFKSILNLCRFRAERDKLSLRHIRIPTKRDELQRLTPKSLLDYIISQFTPKTRTFVVSHVMSGTGLVLPIAEIAKETRRRGIYLVVDGAHAIGSLPVSFLDLNDVDFYAATFQKWMMGPKGTAFGWVNKRYQDSIQPIHAGLNSFETLKQFSVFGGGSRFAIRYLSAASQDFAPFMALDDLIKFWRSRNPETLFKAVRDIRDYAETEIASATSWPCLIPKDPDLRGPMLSFELPPALGKLGTDLMFRLYERYKLQAVVKQIGGGFALRLSPHVFNTRREIRRAATILSMLSSDPSSLL